VSETVALAAGLLKSIGEKTFDGVGITRAPYGAGEEIAIDALSEAARGLGLRLSSDSAGNLYMTWEGTDPQAPGIVIGSHVDSVPQGGNYDGLAGIAAGLQCVESLRKAGLRPRRTITVMGIRAEENAWFGAQHIGSRAALGTLPPAVLDQAKRVDTGRTLAEHMKEAGLDVAQLRQGKAHLDASRLHCYLELHIEQGPVLVEERFPIGIVTGIRGNVRYREIVCRGEYGHSGTVPRRLRQDAVMAVSELVMACDRIWSDIEAEGGDFVLTVGRCFTDPKAHSLTTIPGEVRFSLDARSHSSATLERFTARLAEEAKRIASARRVTFDFGSQSSDTPSAMDPDLRSLLKKGCAELGIRAMEMASGAGHDAGDFASAGVRTAMIFVRNDHGSHNPKEAMEIADFAHGVRLLGWLVRALDR
jgi:beta-ureidopropionase / N-carbamoyl-L-amino-acid hydrolase